MLETGNEDFFVTAFELCIKGSDGIIMHYMQSLDKTLNSQNNKPNNSRFQLICAAFTATPYHGLPTPPFF